MPRKPPLGKSLAELNPDLAKEWHPTKNGFITPYDVGLGSGKKVWWKCDKGEDHEWVSRIDHRSNGVGCPICSNRKTVLSNCLVTLNPELAKEWHPTKNGNLTPYDVNQGSNKKVWWKCDKGKDHEWQSAVSNRSNGKGCPVCSGRKAVLSNCLATLNPELAKEWHPTKNENLTPYDVKGGSNKKVWWKCDKGKDHEWQSAVDSRTNGKGCPVCSGRKAVLSNCLATLNPELAKEWHPTKNENLTPYDVKGGSDKKVWWKCKNGNDHEWQSAVYSRSNGNGCPICIGQKIVLSNCLAALNPELAKEWHPTKNGNLTAYDVTENSGKDVWWKCDKGDDHEWQSAVRSRSYGNGCPVCSGNKTVLSNCLATLNPKLAKQWHPTKNGDLTPFDITCGSNRKVWWKCDKGDDHEWKTSTSHRSGGLGCPYCTLTPQSKQELTITFELIKFFEISPKGFKSRVNGKIMSIDIFISEFNLGIEFDGNYWHKGKRELDKLKTEKLEENGFTIMRVRQEPLKAITDIDVISKTPFNAKKVTNDILEHIMQVYPIDVKRTRKIEKYFLKESIQNEKNLDAYIEMILTEKAEKNGKTS
jgi:hypothetical protein